MKRHLTIIILVASFCSTGRDDHAAPSPVPISSDEPANAGPFVLWAREHSIGITTLEPGHGFADLQPLKAAIGQARVVALGESLHDSHEPLAFRNRLWEFLVQEMDFTALAVETGFWEGIQVDDFVQGKTADVETVSRNVFAWSFEKAYDENRQLVEWMREHNHRAPADRKLRFYGIDLTGGRSGEFIAARQALDASLAYLERVDSALGQGFRSRLEPFLSKFQDKAYSTLSPNERSSLTATIAELVSVFQRRRIAFLEQTTENDYARAFRQTVVAQYLDALFRNSPAPDVKDPDFLEAAIVRDSAMADNLRWVLEREGPRGRVLVFAHNGHVSKSGATKEAYPKFFPRKPRASMGQYLHSFLRDEMMVIGFTFKEGIPGIPGFKGESPLAALDSDSLDGQLACVGAPLFLVDLRTAAKAGPVADWLNRATKTRKNDRYIELKPINAFDALLFVETVSAAHEIQPLRSTIK